MMDTVPALREAASDWADQGCIATADLMREAADTIEYLRKLIGELEQRVAEDDARWSQLTIRAADTGAAA